MSTSENTAVTGKPSNWNLPNALTTLRIVLVPFYGWALLYDNGDSVTWLRFGRVDHRHACRG